MPCVSPIFINVDEVVVCDDVHECIASWMSGWVRVVPVITGSVEVSCQINWSVALGQCGTYVADFSFVVIDVAVDDGEAMVILFVLCMEDLDVIRDFFIRE